MAARDVDADRDRLFGLVGDDDALPYAACAFDCSVDRCERLGSRLLGTARCSFRAFGGAARAAAPAPEPLAPVHAPVEGRRRVRQGVVVSDKAEKTITVRIDVARRHRRYEKIVRSSSTLHAHDENNEAHEGDVVRVIKSRPLSRTKRWALVDVLERAR